MDPVEYQKSNGNYYGAGALARALNQPRSYGCHYGMRSDRERSMQSFYKGWDACDRHIKEEEAKV